MTPIELEGIAEEAYARAGFSSDAPRSTLRIAAELLGWDRIRLVPGLDEIARLEGSRLLLREGANDNDLEWFTGCELARWLRHPLEDHEVRRIAACLRAPRRAVQVVARETGPAFSDLAAAFAVDQSCAALRYGEVTGTPLALFAPARPIRFRGSGPNLMKARKIRLTDDPARVVKLFAC